MKKILSTFFCCCCCSIILQAQHYTLAMNLEKGKTYIHNNLVSSNIHEVIAGKSMDIITDISCQVAYTVTNLEADIYSIEVRYKSLSMKLGMSDKTIEYSSTKKDSVDEFSSIMNTLIDRPFYIKMNRLGKIIEVKRFDSVFAEMTTQMKGISEAQKQRFRTTLEKSYGENSFRNNFESITALFPEHKVAIGESWIMNSKKEFGYNISENIKTTFTLKEVTAEGYKITGIANMYSDTTKDYADVNGLPCKYNFSGTTQYSFILNKATGWSTQANINTELKGDGIIGDCPKIPGGLTIPMTVTSNSVLSGK